MDGVRIPKQEAKDLAMLLTGISEIDTIQMAQYLHVCAWDRMKCYPLRPSVGDKMQKYLVRWHEKRPLRHAMELIIPYVIFPL